MKPGDDSLIIVSTLLEFFLNGEMTPNAFASIYVTMYPRFMDGWSKAVEEDQEELWMACQDHEGPETETQLRNCALNAYYSLRRFLDASSK